MGILDERIDRHLGIRQISQPDLAGLERRHSWQFVRNIRSTGLDLMMREARAAAGQRARAVSAMGSGLVPASAQRSVELNQGQSFALLCVNEAELRGI